MSKSLEALREDYAEFKREQARIKSMQVTQKVRKKALLDGLIDTEKARDRMWTKNIEISRADIGPLVEGGELPGIRMFNRCYTRPEFVDMYMNKILKEVKDD